MGIEPEAVDEDDEAMMATTAADRKRPTPRSSR